MKKLLIQLALLTSFLSAENAVKTETPSLQTAVQKAVDTYSKQMNNTGILLLVSQKGKTYKASAGFADRKSKRKVKTDDLFEIGSASKVFTGIAILQLIEKGKLSLDTKLNTFYKEGEIKKLANFKGKNYWDDVTVEMLLQHTNGFIDYLNVYGDDAKSIKILGGKKKHYTFEQLIHQAVGFGDANFKPGEKFKYSNTGYIILGDIITKVSGDDWHDYMQKNILDKVGMQHTYFGTRLAKDLRDSMPKGHMQSKETFMAPSLASSAGEIVSTLDDLALLMKSWAEGKLYTNPKTLEIQLKEGFNQQDDRVENLYYGYALMRLDGFYGHVGQTFGFQSYMGINPESGDIYVVGTNDSMVGSSDLFMGLAGLSYKQ